MRTTLNLDPQLLSTAKRLAAARSVALGDIISELANKGLEAQSQEHNQRSAKRKSGFPVFKSPKGAAMIGLDDVKQDED
jgi:predicted DNA-binding ribbon-helix-helix protein